MKKIGLFLFLFQTIVSGYSQPYRPLPLDSITTWRIHFAGMDELGPCQCTSDYLYKTAGDTVVGTYTYTKIKRIGNPFCFCNMSLTTMGIIRQDSIARKVYILEPDSTNEKILYDFTQQVGDTVNSILWPPPPSCPHSTISKVDSILINGQYHRRLEIQPNGCTFFNVYFIEGIGSTQGLFEQLIYNIEIFANLVCVSHNGITLFPDSSTTCDTALLVQEYTETNTRVQLYPNPVQKHQAVKITSDQPIHKIELFDSRMSLVQTVNTTGKEYYMTLNNVPAGIYFMQVSTDSYKKTINKLIIE